MVNRLSERLFCVIFYFFKVGCEYNLAVKYLLNICKVLDLNILYIERKKERR